MTWIGHHTWQSLGTGVVSWYVLFCVWAVLQSSLLSLSVEAQTKGSEQVMNCHKIESPKKLIDRLSEVSADWKILAEDLGVDTSTIDEIQLDEHKTKNKYRAVLHAWYDSQEPHACWEPVLAVLRGMGKNRLAGEIDTCLSKGCNCELVPKCTGTSQANKYACGSLDEDCPVSQGYCSTGGIGDADISRIVAQPRDVQETIWNNTHACGLAIIVSNDYRDSKRPLPGTAVDARVMKEAIEELGFATHVRSNLEANEIKALAKAATVSEYPDSYKCIIFVFSGHGSHHNGADEIIGQDKVAVGLSNVVEPFFPGNAPKIGKLPKLFFIDACRGGKEMAGIVVPRDLKELIMPKKGNILVAQSTMLGYVAYEEKGRGGLWMSRLAETLKESNEEIGAILARVNEKLLEEFQMDGTIQQPGYRSSLNVRVYPRKLAASCIQGNELNVNSYTAPKSDDQVLAERPNQKHFLLIKWDNNGREESLRLSEELSDSWHDLGTIFGYGTFLAGYREQYLNDPRKCLDAVLGKWLREGSRPKEAYPLTWAGFIKALHDLHLDMADTLRKVLPRKKND